MYIVIETHQINRTRYVVKTDDPDKVRNGKLQHLIDTQQLGEADTEGLPEKIVSVVSHDDNSFLSSTGNQLLENVNNLDDEKDK